MELDPIEEPEYQVPRGRHLREFNRAADRFFEKRGLNAKPKRGFLQYGKPRKAKKS